MCLPAAALATASLAASVAGTAVSTYGAVQGAKAQNISLEAQKISLGAQADAARTNAALADITANNITVTSGLNAGLTLALGEENARMTEGISALNLSTMAQLADLNSMMAEGDYQFIIGQGDLQAAVAEGNAKIAESQAQSVLRAGQREEQGIMFRGAQLKSSQRAALASNGIALDSDGALRVLTSTDILTDIDAATSHANAVNQAFGYRAEAAQYQSDADAARVNARIEGFKVRAEAAGARVNSNIDMLNLELQAQSEAMSYRTGSKLDALNITQQGQSAAFNAKMSALGYRNDATAATVARSSISPAISPALAGTATFLQGASQVASSWYSFSKSGVWSDGLLGLKKKKG